MKKNFLKYSFWLSAISIGCTVIINFKISQDYLESVGKDRAFFAFQAAFSYVYQYYFAILGLVALIFILLSKQTNTRTNRKLQAAGLAVFSIILVFVKLWRLFAWIFE